MKIGMVNIEYIMYFPKRIEILPLFPVNKKERLFHAVVVKVNSYKIKQLTYFFCCGTYYVILFQKHAVLKVATAQEMRR
jgi:hypothetical protein